MSLDSVLVSNVMKTDVKTENENQNVMAVCKVMYDNDIGCVVVIKEQGKDKIPVGIITERDIVRALGKLTIFLSMPLSKFMNKPIISIQSVIIFGSLAIRLKMSFSVIIPTILSLASTTINLLTRLESINCIACLIE